MRLLVMEAPDIRWWALAPEAGDEEGRGDEYGAYDLAAYRLAVAEGGHPDGEPLSDLLPRWALSDADPAGFGGLHAVVR